VDWETADNLSLVEESAHSVSTDVTDPGNALHRVQPYTRYRQK